MNDQSQVVSVGYDVSQKAHSALRWIVKKNGSYIDDMTVAAWEISGKDIPDIMSGSIFSTEAEDDSYEDSIGTIYAAKLRKALKGYRQELGSHSDIVAMGLEAATTGRLSVCFYDKMRGSDFMDNIEKWYSICCWRWNKNVGNPSLKRIAEAAYRKQNSKVLKGTIVRLLPCIIKGQAIPDDIVKNAVNAASNPESFDKYWEWQQAIGIACALVRKHQHDRSGSMYAKERKEWSMEVDGNERNRSYLFGRLVAAAQKVEEMALYIAGAETRTTAAERYFMQMQDRPAATWKTIVNSLQPYIARLKNTGAYKYVEEMNAICALIEPEDFVKNERLSEIFMLGYSCQFNKYIDERRERKENK